MKNLFQNRWFLLFILTLTWGSSFILIKKSLVSFTPYQVGAIRVGVAGLLLAGIGIPAIRKMPRKTLMWATLSGFFGNFFPMFLFPLAQTHVSSSMAGILDALVPLFVLIAGFLFFGIRSQWVQIIGALVGFSGVGILIWFSEDPSGSTQTGYAMLIVLATLCYAFSALIIKEKLQHVPSMQLSGTVFTIWCLPALSVLVGSGIFRDFQSTPETWTSLGYLGILTIVGTAVAIILYYRLIQQTTAVFASSVTYLIPLVATAWGFLDGEVFTLWYVIGSFLILLGIYLIRERK